MVNGCPFCGYEGPSPILLERNGVYFIEPINPVTEGHVLAIPHGHVEDAQSNYAVTGAVMQEAAWFSAGQCNLITSVGALATQTVKHLHVHIVPRREGDGSMLPWSEYAAVLTTPEASPGSVSELAAVSVPPEEERL